MDQYGQGRNELRPHKRFVNRSLLQLTAHRGNRYNLLEILTWRRAGYHETYLATQAHPAQTCTRVHEAHVHPQWTACAEGPPRQRALEIDRLICKSVTNSRPFIGQWRFHVHGGCAATAIFNESGSTDGVSRPGCLSSPGIPTKLRDCGSDSWLENASRNTLCNVIILNACSAKQYGMSCLNWPSAWIS